MAVIPGSSHHAVYPKCFFCMGHKNISRATKYRRDRGYLSNGLDQLKR